jgi:nickel/cobalt exporter
MFLRKPFLLGVLFLLGTGSLHAHPVPQGNHDRTIEVRLDWDAKAKQIAVLVKYRLEVDEDTVVFDDLKPFKDELDFRLKGLKFYGQFTKLYGPIFAGNLTATANGKPLTFSCVDSAATLKDEKDQVLGHLRCDFIFRAGFSPHKDKDNVFAFKEDNYQLQKGKIDLSLTHADAIKIKSKIEPDAKLKTKPLTEYLPGDEDKLRELSATLMVSSGTQSKEENPNLPKPKEESPPPDRAHDDSFLRLFLNSEHGFWVLLLLAMGIGAVHALTPGHGKTLVAAYLVGQQGTVWHALILGLVTTVTHTGVVILLAVILLFVPRENVETIQMGLGLTMGLIVTGMGVFLLLRRLAGRADHIHLGGGHHHHHGDGDYHHHHHGDGNHHHHHHDHEHGHHHDAPEAAGPLSTWGIIVLGMSGGIIPCTDAIGILFITLGTSQFWLALPMLLAFSAGLAGVLVLIGILVVKGRNFATSKLGEGRLVRALPILSAIFVTAIGVWLCVESVRGHP